MNFTPMAKRSKRAQREHYAAKRGSWNGLSPVTRVVQSKKTYDRNRVKREARRSNDELSLRSAPISPVGAVSSLFHIEKHRKGLAKS